MADKIDQLLDQEEKLHTSAVARTFKAYKDNPTHANLKDYEAAKKGLEEFRKGKAGDKIFKKLPEVLEYLQAEGWKIQKSTLYEKEFAIKKRTDGGMLKKDVDAFAEKFLRKVDSSEPDSDYVKKVEAEVEKLRIENERNQLKLDAEKGLYVLRSEVEQMLAGRAALLKDGLGQNFIHSRAPKIIEAVKGDSERAGELIDLWLAEIESVFDYYSKPMKFDVPIAAVGEDGKM